MKKLMLSLVAFMLSVSASFASHTSNDGFVSPGISSSTVQVTTTTTLSAPSSVPVYGDPNTYFATVTVAAKNGVTLNGQRVLFHILNQDGSEWGGGPFAHGLANGAATFGLSLPQGSYTLRAEFPSQGNYLASQSAAQTLNVGLSSATATVFSSFPASPISVNDNTQSCTVQVTSGGKPLTGNYQVQLSILASSGANWNGSPFTHTSLDANGTTTFSLSISPADTYTIQATFPAQGVYSGSQTPAAQVIVSQSPQKPIQTRTVLSLPASVAWNDTSKVGSVTVTAADGSTPTGTVQVFVAAHRSQPTLDNYFSLTTVSLVNGAATFSTYPLPRNLDVSPTYQYDFIAYYGPDSGGKYQGSNSPPVLVVINPQSPPPPGGSSSTTTTITAPPITDGSDAIVQVTVTSPSGTPTGSVQLSISGGGGIPATLNSAGVATYNLHPTGGPGDYTLDATYVPTGNFQASTAHGDLIVNPAGGGGGGPVATNVSISVPASINVGNVTARAVVTVMASDGTTPTGQIGLAFSGFNNNQPFWYTLDSKGQHAYSLGSLPVGTYQLIATYMPTGNYLASTGNAMLNVLPQGAPVGPIGTTVVIKAPTSPIPANDQSQTATVQVVAADGSIPTGTIGASFSGFRGGQTFYHLLKNGQTIYGLGLPSGTYTMTATYPKQGAWGTSTAHVTIQVK